MHVYVLEKDIYNVNLSLPKIYVDNIKESIMFEILVALYWSRNLCDVHIDTESYISNLKLY